MAIADFVIEAVLHETPRATIYRARDARTRVVVALKVGRRLAQGDVSLDELAPALWGAGGVGDLVAHESRVLAALDHPGIPAVVEHGLEGARSYLATRWIDGAPVEPGLRGAALVEVFARVAEILDHAHRRGVIHRDVKPSNLRVAHGPDGVEVSVLDWELAMLGGVGARGIVGTRQYLAPEMLAADRAPAVVVNGRADLYSLGATIFHAVTGEPPFAAAACPAAHVLAHPPSLAARGGVASPALERVVARLLAKDPAARFASGREVAEQLRAPSLDAAEAALAAGDLVTVARALDHVGGERGGRWGLLAAGLSLALAQPQEALAALALVEPGEPLPRPDGPPDPSIAAEHALLSAEARRRTGAIPAATQLVAAAAAAGDHAALAELARCQRAASRFEDAHLTCLRLYADAPAAGTAALREQVSELLARCWDAPPRRWLALLAVSAVQLELASRSPRHELARLARAAGGAALDDDVIGWPFVAAMIVAHARCGDPAAPPAIMARTATAPPTTCWARAGITAADAPDHALQVALCLADLGFADAAREHVRGRDPATVSRVARAVGERAR